MEYPELAPIIEAIILGGLALALSSRVRESIKTTERRFASVAIATSGACTVFVCYAALASPIAFTASLAWAILAPVAFFASVTMGWFLVRGAPALWLRVIGWLGLAFPAALIATGVIKRLAV